MHFLFLWDKLIGTLFFVCIISLVFDYFIFIKKDLVKIKNFDNQVVIENFRDNIDYMKSIEYVFNFIENFSYL